MRPQIVQHGKQRELCDILLSYHGGSILIESKALGFSSRRKLASRDELAQDCRKHVRKAERQLRGAWRQIKSGAIVTDREGVTYEVERTAPPHCIILVPDLSLLSGEGSAEGIYLVAKFGQDLQGFLHLLDPSSLLRTSQAAAMLSAAGTSTTPMMAFDAWLIERWNKAIELGQVDFDVRLTIGP
jgi:hypothetical protein